LIYLSRPAVAVSNSLPFAQAVLRGRFSGWQEYGGSGVGRDTGKAGSTLRRKRRGFTGLAGVERYSDEPIGQALGEFVEGVAT
jgi:hypothetical protein